MSDSRRRARETSNDALGSPSRVVIPRRSIFSADPDPTDHIDRVEETEPSEEPHPNHSGSSTAVPPSILSSPIVPSSPILPNSTSIMPNQIEVLRWDWMPDILRRWRQAEQIPILPEVPSPYTPIPPFTQEHVHQTIPILITRLLTHDHQLDQLEQAAHDRMDPSTSEVELLKHKVSELENDLNELRDIMIAAHNEGVEEVMLLRQQLGESQRHISEMREEIATMRTEREQLRADAEASSRMADLLGNMEKYLR